jgi:release factor glutamine methyltransferase
VTIRTALLQGTKLLEDAAVSVPRLTAEVLLAHALGKDRVYLMTYPEQELSELGWIHYGRYLHERTGGKPTQHITHKQEFYGRNFYVSPDVLIPRPETEHVVERALELGKALAPSPRIADIGCGSGAIGITVALELNRPVLLADICPKALHVARRNALALNAAVTLTAADLTAALAPRSLDLLLSNPPYIPESEGPRLQREVRDFEPSLALYGGEDGLHFYRRLIADAPRVLKPGGWLVMELAYRAAPGVLAMLDHKWADAHVGHDLAGLPRVFSARLS